MTSTPTLGHSNYALHLAGSEIDPNYQSNKTPYEFGPTGRENLGLGDIVAKIAGINLVPAPELSSEIRASAVANIEGNYVLGSQEITAQYDGKFGEGITQKALAGHSVDYFREQVEEAKNIYDTVKDTEGNRGVTIEELIDAFGVDVALSALDSSAEDKAYNLLKENEKLNDIKQAYSTKDEKGRYAFSTKELREFYGEEDLERTLNSIEYSDLRAAHKQNRTIPDELIEDIQATYRAKSDDGEYAFNVEDIKKNYGAKAFKEAYDKLDAEDRRSNKPKQKAELTPEEKEDLVNQYNRDDISVDDIVNEYKERTGKSFSKQRLYEAVREAEAPLRSERKTTKTSSAVELSTTSPATTHESTPTPEIVNDQTTYTPNFEFYGSSDEHRSESSEPFVFFSSDVNQSGSLEEILYGRRKQSETQDEDSVLIPEGVEDIRNDPDVRDELELTLLRLIKEGKFAEAKGLTEALEAAPTGNQSHQEEEDHLGEYLASKKPKDEDEARIYDLIAKGDFNAVQEITAENYAAGRHLPKEPVVEEPAPKKEVEKPKISNYLIGNTGHRDLRGKTNPFTLSGTPDGLPQEAVDRLNDHYDSELAPASTVSDKPFKPLTEPVYDLHRGKTPAQVEAWKAEHALDAGLDDIRRRKEKINDLLSNTAKGIAASLLFGTVALTMSSSAPLAASAESKSTETLNTSKSSENKAKPDETNNNSNESTPKKSGTTWSDILLNPTLSTEPPFNWDAYRLGEE